MASDITTTDSATLRRMVADLRSDAAALWAEGSPQHREEAMRLFRLFRRLAAEQHRRRNPALRDPAAN